VAGSLGIWDPRALSGAGWLANGLPSPWRVFWLTNGSAAGPADRVGLWLERGLRGPKLPCPPRLTTPPMAGRNSWSGGVMIAVDPDQAGNTAAVLGPVSTAVIEPARFASTLAG